MPEEIPEDSWPRLVEGAWNTSDSYRFFNEQKAREHQQRVDEREANGSDDS